jgi:hypothetical protein
MPPANPPFPTALCPSQYSLSNQRTGKHSQETTAPVIGQEDAEAVARSAVLNGHFDSTCRTQLSRRNWVGNVGLGDGKGRVVRHPLCEVDRSNRGEGRLQRVLVAVDRKSAGCQSCKSCKMGLCCLHFEYCTGRAQKSLFQRRKRFLYSQVDRQLAIVKLPVMYPSHAVDDDLQDTRSFRCVDGLKSGVVWGWDCGGKQNHQTNSEFHRREQMQVRS